MLTADLVRASVAKGVVRPRYVSVEDPDMRAEAERLIAVFNAHVGKCRGALDEAIADLIGDSPQFMVTRGLARLLTKSTEIETVAAVEPEVVRAKVFEVSAARWPVTTAGAGVRRDVVLAEAGEALGISAEQVEAALFADLEREQVLVSVGEWTPEGLLHRYNLALAQGVLLKASEVRITLGNIGAKRARRVFQMLKFHRLMYRAERVKLSAEPSKKTAKAKAKATNKRKATKKGDAESPAPTKSAGYGYVITLDGPLSLFQQTTRYGLQLALFLPTLCHCERWSVQADVVWGKEQKARKFEVDQDTGLVTHTADKGTWEADEERQFRAAFKAHKSPWKLRRGATIVDLKGRGVFVPDYVLVHPDGRKALLDIVWFWRKQSFAKRLELLKEVGPDHLIVALATKYKVDAKGTAGLEAIDAALRGKVYPFKGVIQPKKVVALAEAIGRP